MTTTLNNSYFVKSVVMGGVKIAQILSMWFVHTPILTMLTLDFRYFVHAEARDLALHFTHSSELMTPIKIISIVKKSHLENKMCNLILFVCQKSNLKINKLSKENLSPKVFSSIHKKFSYHSHLALFLFITNCLFSTQHMPLSEKIWIPKNIHKYIVLIVYR